MDVEEFRRSPCGRLVPTLDGAWAFVPDPLPPTVDLGPLAALLAEASLGLGELKGMARSLASPELLIRPLQRREAVASSAIEGTMTSLSELYLLEAGADAKRRPPGTPEVHDYVRALEHATQRLTHAPLSLHLIREIHGILRGGSGRHRRGGSRPGAFRQHQTWIGGDSVRSARLVPPPPDQLRDCLEGLETFIRSTRESPIPPLIALAMVHYQFETIHPFADGNGRLGRLLLPLILLSRGVLPWPLLCLSPFFARHYGDYANMLYNVSRRGAWLDWFAFFLAAVAEQCRDTIVRVEALEELRAGYRAALAPARGSGLLLRLVDLAFAEPVFTIPRAQAVLGVTHRGAALNVAKLVDRGVLADMALGRRPRYFLAHQVMEVIGSETAGPGPARARRRGP